MDETLGRRIEKIQKWDKNAYDKNVFRDPNICGRNELYVKHHGYAAFSSNIVEELTWKGYNKLKRRTCATYDVSKGQLHTVVIKEVSLLKGEAINRVATVRKASQEANRAIK